MFINNLRTANPTDFNLKNINFNLEPGQILTLIGRSGSGKSTLLRCLAGLDKYHVDHEVKSSQMGFVFQSVNLFPHLNLYDNISLALRKVQKKNNQEIEKIVSEVLSLVHLEQKARHFPHQLSGGENQRGAIARTLALKPTTIFYDEPTSALDPELVDEIFEIILKLKKQNMTQIIVTHELKAVKKISDRVGFMSQGELKLFCPFPELNQHFLTLNEEDQKYVQLFN